MKKREKHTEILSENRTKRDRGEDPDTHSRKQIGQEGVDGVRVAWGRERWLDL
jgi:hypothetical protein